MKRIVIILVLVILLGGGAAAASIFLGIGPLATMMKPKEPPQPPPPPPPPQHKEVVVGSFVIPVIQDHGIGRSLGLDVALDVLAEDDSKVETQLPRLQNAFTLSLYEVVPSHSDAHSANDKKAIHDRLVAITERILGKGVVQDVVIKSIYDR